ncbi:hypothetical protein GCM10027347_52840 [Larkinella harenae]
MAFQMPIHKQTPYCVGIDPDIKASGVSVWSRTERRLIFSKAMPFAQWLEWLQTEDPDNVFFFVEAGWLNKTANYHTVKLPARMANASVEAKARYTSGVRERVSKDVGQNHATGKLMVEVLEHFGFGHVLIQPKSKKWTPDEYTHFTGLKTKNQDIIDSARLVVGL